MRTFWPIAILALVGLLVWLGFERPAPRPGVVVTAVARAESAPTRQIPAGPAPRIASSPVPDLHPGQVEVCGLGWVDAEPSEAQQEAIGQKIVAFAQQGRRELVRRLSESGDPFIQAVGQIAKALGDIEEGRVQGPMGQGAESCAGAACPEEVLRVQTMTRLIDELARRAAQSVDPRLYGLAYKLCIQSLVESCTFLNARQWARLDPENAAPWLYALNENAADKSRSTMDEVLFQIAKAKRFDDQYFSVAGEIARHAAEDNSSIWAANQAAVGAIGMSAARSISVVQDLMQGCRDTALNDANRRQLCEGAARTLAGRSDTLLMTRMGIGMGRRLGWDPALDDETRGLIMAGGESFSEEFGNQNEAMGCGGMRKLLKLFDRQAEIGEMGWARESVKTRGRTQEEYTKKGRDARLLSEVEEARRKQAQAASAAQLSPNALIHSKPN